MRKLSQMAAGLGLFILCTLPVPAAELQTLHGHVPRAVADLKLPAIGRLPATMILQLAIGLPLRNQEGLSNCLKDIYTPGSPNFRKFFTPQQFTEKFGPTEEDYQALIEFAKANSLAVTGTFTNRALLDLKVSVADIERVFHITMRVYQHPTEGRTFFAPDGEPSLNLTVPVLHISGLDNYILPHPSQQRPAAANAANGTPNGSGPYDKYTAKDLRTAYVPGVSLTGSGQSVGLLEFAGYFSDRIQAYEHSNSLANVTLTTVLLDGATGIPDTSNYGYTEAELDIEMAIAMAPGLGSVIVYELPEPAADTIPWPADDLLNRMATDNLAKQLSSSWEYQVTPNTDEIFQELAAQGQSFFQASGDLGALPSIYVTPPHDDPYITQVGGTELAMTPNGSAWASEVVWGGTNAIVNGNQEGSGGGISPTYAIPWYQEGVNMTANGGSTIMRNIPDVAIVADGVSVYLFESGEADTDSGTSISAPLWAAFMALANQLEAEDGLPSIGFANPALYAIGKASNYTSCFHDITTGNNTNQYSPDAFAASSGYDLCTGWGTPYGQALINALVTGVYPSGLVYVQFGNSDPGVGTWARPYNTLARGTNGVPAGGEILIKGPGSSAETMKISKPMTIGAVSGAATVGN